MSSQPHEDRYLFAKEMAKAGGQLTLQYFQDHQLEVEKKGDTTPVTVADRGCEELIRKHLGERFPEDGIVGEEFGVKEGSSGYRWILDPIDGTKSFISGVPLYGTMVAVEFEGQVVAGVIYNPGLDEMVSAIVGGGCWHEVNGGAPRKAQVSKCSTLSDAKLMTSEVKTYGERGCAEVFATLEKAAYLSRTWGDCYGYILVATGRVDVMLDPVVKIWDVAAVKPIIEEAGGTYTDWNGEPNIESIDAVATNGQLHDEVLGIIRPLIEPS